MSAGETHRLTPTQVRRMLDFAEEDNLRDHLLLLTMVLTGLSRGEIVGAPTRVVQKIYNFTRSRNKREREVKMQIADRLQQGEPTLQHEGSTYRLTGNGRFVERTKPEPALPGLLVENLRDDGTILVKERLSPGRLLKLDSYLFGKYKKYIGDRKDGGIFDITSGMVLKIAKKYADLAAIPFPVKTQMLTAFYADYKPSLPGILGISVFSEEYIEARIRDGENEEVEWKLSIGDSADFCETMVSFANRIGGIILVGVDKDGNVQGVSDDLPVMEEKITNINDEFCDPHVLFSVTISKVHGRSVAVVQVKEGMDKPYWMKDKGFVIRNGSSDRIMKRSEIISLILRAYGVS